MCELKLVKIEGLPPTSYFVIKQNEEIIGHCLLNHEAKSNDLLPRDFVGHIFYEVFDEINDINHVKVAINKLIVAAKHMNLKDIFIIAKENNLPSKDILGGRSIFVVDTTTGHDGLGYIRYKVSC